MKGKTAILLINVGSPDKPEILPVFRYLFRFLNDPRVIDLPWLARILLVNGIIIPFRIRKSTGLYKQLWTSQGSPLILFSIELKAKLQDNAADGVQFFIGMRYGNPGIKMAVSEIRKGGFNRIIVVPLYPQYAESTTGSAMAAVQKELARQHFGGEVASIPPFFNHPGFTSAFSERIRSYHPEEYDHVLFSYHGLPERQVEKCHPGITVRACSCDRLFPDHGINCYRAACYETTRLLVASTELPEGKYSVSFQSRLSRNWLAPFTDETVIRLAKEGKKRVLVAAPSFVTDCLETKVEIGRHLSELFRKHGGEKLCLVESLNTMSSWVDALAQMVAENGSTPADN